MAEPIAPSPTLVMHFQGICAFLRNRQALKETTEVTTVLVAGEKAQKNLCAHAPVLVFAAKDFVSTEGRATHFTALLSGDTEPRPGLGIWPLAGKDLRIVGAPEGKLSLDSTFAKTADFAQLASRQGAASRECLAPDPPAKRLVAGRVFLTAGRLSVTRAVGDNGDPDDRWVFDSEGAKPTSGLPVPFSQELRYEFFGDPDQNTIQLEAKTIGKEDEIETLTLSIEEEGVVRVAISNLCPIESRKIEEERDFLAYYELLVKGPAQPVIPVRLHNPNGSPVRIGLSACPPATAAIEEGS
jgi:hypothetical protein